MIVSLNPTYYCNFRCPFCYLSKDQLADKTTLDLDGIENRFMEILSHGDEIDGVDIYGGEISQMPAHQMESIIELLRLLNVPTINIITNLSEIPEYFYHKDINLYVSYDYKAREQNKKVLENMRSLDRDFHILTLASYGMLRQDLDNFIEELNTLENLKTLEVKPYSASKWNQQPVSFKDFEGLIIALLRRKNEMNFHFVNEDLILDSLKGKRNAFSDDHIYITPSGNFGVLEFDDNDNEFFLELSSFKEYIDWSDLEKIKVHKNSYCNQCKYFGSCLSEHLREVKDISQSCNGFKYLLDWYSESLFQE